MTLLLIALALAGCGSDKPPSSVPVTIADMGNFLATSRCANGSLAVLSSFISPGCVVGTPQRAADPMLFRRRDWSGHTDGQIEDAYLGAAGYINTFAYPPHGPFVAANGDGGDVVVLDRTSARISFTQNGAPGGGTVSGYWVGKGCGGDGWLLFDNTAPTGSWASKIATLAASADPNACPKLDSAFTRWRLETIDIPFKIDGVQRMVSLLAIVSEHYAGKAIEGAASMERVIMAEGVGRVRWQAWARAVNPFVSSAPPAPFASKCPATAPWTDAPAAGWVLHDDRCLTEIVPGDAAMTGIRFAWP